MPTKEDINFKFLIMSNLGDFKVEALEQRLEMGKWSAKVGTSTNTSTGVTTLKTELGVTF